jgi:hypothetical protein
MPPLIEDLGTARKVETVRAPASLPDFEACHTLWAFVVWPESIAAAES